MLPKLLTTTDPKNYAQYLSEKTSNIANIFARAGLIFPVPEIFASKPEYYRMRAEFAVYFTDESRNFSYVMYVPNTSPKERIELNQFPIASHAINEGMRLIQQYAPGYEYLTRKLFAINFLSNQQGQLIIDLEYHKQLNEPIWREQVLRLKNDLQQHGTNADFVGRARKQEFLVNSKTLLENLSLSDREFKLYQVEGCFTQPNIYICQQMVDYVRQHCGASQDSDLLELYCGSGTFTVCLADKFRKVLATEISRFPTQTALKNIELNRITNTKLIRLSAAEVAEALQNVRSFRRLKEANVDLDEYLLNTLLIDPPRCGLRDEATLSFTASFKRIIYISCNPLSLLEDLKVLQKTHKIEHLAFFDQFPYTEHVETIVLLTSQDA